MKVVLSVIKDKSLQLVYPLKYLSVKFKVVHSDPYILLHILLASPHPNCTRVSLPHGIWQSDHTLSLKVHYK